MGHLRWGGALFEPVVEELLERLRNSPVMQGDESGWRINGQTAWAWCFRDPKLAILLIENHDAILDLITANVWPTAFGGNLWVVAPNGSGDMVTVLLASMDGTFQEQQIGVGRSPSDFNGDGRPNLATENYSGKDVSVLITSPQKTGRVARLH